MSRRNQQPATPKLRFPEFRDAGTWRERPFSDVLSEHGEKSTGVEEVFSVSVHKGLINQVEHLGRSFSASSTDHYNRVLPGDVVYTKSPTGDFPFGIIKQSKLDVPVIVSPLYAVFSPQTTALGTILEAYFESPANAKFFLEPLVQKGAKNTINIKNDRFLSGTLILPLDKAEQQKIADCLGSLDDLITAEGRKLEALRDHKKGLMQQLFPREGETQPRLRFPEFRGAGDWKKKSLFDLFHFQDGFGFNSTDFVNAEKGATQVIRIADINNKNMNVDKVYIPNAFHDSTGLTKYFVENGDLLLSLTGAAGFNFFLWNGDRAVINQRTAKITPKKRSNAALTRLLEPLIHERINVRGEGQNNNLSKKFLKTVVFRIPESDEQDRIADCLSALDARIAAQEEKLAALQQHKKGLMQQLFPKPAEVGA